MKVIVNANKKGGVAKTTSSIHFSAWLAMNKNKKVLVIDFDPQCSLSDGYGIDYENYPYTAHDLMEGRSGLRFKNKIKNHYILVGSPLLDTVQYQDIYVLKNRIGALCEMSRKQLEIDFDFVIIDISPADLLNKHVLIKGKEIFLPKLNQIALAAADYVTIPLITDRFSVKGLQGFIKDVINIKKEFNPSLDIAGVFFNKVNVIENDFKRFYKNVEKGIPKKYFIENFIRKDSSISKAVDEGENIFKVAPNSRAAKDYMQVCNEIYKNII